VVQRKLRVDKQQQLEGICVELKAANSKGNSRQLFQIVKSMTRKFHPRLQGIQSATGENLTEAAQIAYRWKGYCEDLYYDQKGKGIEQEYWEQEPPPLRSQVARAICQTANCKATGPDEIPAELFKAGGETVLDRMHRVCVAIWETGEWPEEWTFSTFIPLPKKGDLKQCVNYRTIALVSHACKILLRIILERIQVKTETEIADEQVGFATRKGDKRSNHESQNTDAQGKRVPTTTLHVLCGLQKGVHYSSFVKNPLIFFLLSTKLAESFSVLSSQRRQECFFILSKSPAFTAVCCYRPH